MATLLRNPIVWMLVFLVILVVLVLCFSAVLTPFVCAIILGYLLAPLVNWFVKFGLSRSFSGFFVLLLSMSLIVGLILLVLPIFTSQAAMLLSSFPGIYERCLLILERSLPEFLEIGLFEKNEFTEMKEILKNQGLQVATYVTAYAFKLIDFLILIFIIPLITFYLE